MTGTVRGWHRYDLAVAVSGVLVMLASFLPWYSTGWAESHDGVDGYATNSASAWAASTWWSVSVAVALAAAVVWSLLVARAARRPLWLRCALPIAVAGAAFVIIGTWRSIPPLGGGGVWTSGGDGGAQVGDITRDELVTYHVDGLDLDVGWGLYVGIAAMTLLAAALVLAGRAAAPIAPAVRHDSSPM